MTDAMPSSSLLPFLFRFEHSYAQLPAVLFSEQRPEPVSSPRLVVYNGTLAQTLGLAAFTDDAKVELASILAGNLLPPMAHPIAQAYAGHQFGHFTMLGDGRAILLGEQIAPDGSRWDIQLKGAGRTPFSRGGDGRAALGPMLREYIISEALYALGIPTTRSLAAVTTGDAVYRGELLPGAILTRVAASHIRVGTFQYAAYQDPAVLQALADYTINRHYLALAGTKNRYLGLLNAVIDAQARLIAQWLQVGFIHGVMNTDNMTLSGETIDYGPCAFMDAYQPQTVFSSIDRGGRYAYGQQPAIAQWNLARLAETLLPLIHPDQQTAMLLATEAVEGFEDRFDAYWLQGMGRKIGLSAPTRQDEALINELLTLMQQAEADFTNTFRRLAGPLDANPESARPCAPAFADWQARWKARLAEQNEPWDHTVARLNAHNPAVIPRNHQVEAALDAATQKGDYSVMEKLLRVLAQPYQALSAENTDYEQPPPASEFPYQTFCGT